MSEVTPKCDNNAWWMSDMREHGYIIIKVYVSHRETRAGIKERGSRREGGREREREEWRGKEWEGKNGEGRNGEGRKGEGRKGDGGRSWRLTRIIYTRLTRTIYIYYIYLKTFCLLQTWGFVNQFVSFYKHSLRSDWVPKPCRALKYYKETFIMQYTCSI